MSAHGGRRYPSPRPPPPLWHPPVTDTTPGMQLLPGRGRWLRLGWPRGGRGQWGLVLPSNSIPSQPPPRFLVFLASRGGGLQGARTTARTLPAPQSGHLILAPKQGERWKNKKGGREGTQFPPDQPYPAYPLCDHPHHSPPLLVPTRFMLPSKVHIFPVLIIVFSGCKQKWPHTAEVSQASVGATSGGEWRRDTFLCLCRDVFPMPDPSQAPGNPKPWAHLHTSHLLWMTPPEKPRRAQSRG